MELPVARGIHYITGTWRDRSVELRWTRLPRSVSHFNSSDGARGS